MSWTWWRSAWSGPWSRRVGLARSAATVLLLLLAGGAGTTLSAQSAGAAPGLKSGYLGTGEDKVYYEAAGAGPAIVFIHDGVLPSEEWDGQFGVFAERFTVVRYDRRGYGRSPVPAGPYSNLQDLGNLLEHLKIDRACLVTGSAGGALAINLTLEHPEKVSALVLVGAIVDGTPFTEHFTTRGGHRPPSLTDPDQLFAWLVRDDPYTVYAGNTAAKDRAMQLVKKYHREPHRPESTPRPPRPAIERLHEIKVPTLILVGEFDIPDVHAQAGALNVGIANSTRLVIRDAAHLLPLEQPELFNKALSEFVRALQPKG